MMERGWRKGNPVTLLVKMYLLSFYLLSISVSGLLYFKVSDFKHLVNFFPTFSGYFPITCILTDYFESTAAVSFSRARRVPVARPAHSSVDCLWVASLSVSSLPEARPPH